MTLFVLTGWLASQHGNHLDLLATTDLPCHLWLGLHQDYPPRVPRYKTRQGRQYQCGWLLNWAGTTYHEQTEPGPSNNHTFSLSVHRQDFPTYSLLTEAHPVALGIASTPPIGIPRGPNALLNLEQNTNQALPVGIPTPIAWDTLVSSSYWPTPPTPFTDLPAPDPYETNWVSIIGILASGPLTVTITYRNVTTAQLLDGNTFPFPGPGLGAIGAGISEQLLDVGPYQTLVTNNGPSAATTAPVFSATTTSIWFAQQ